MTKRFLFLLGVVLISIHAFAFLPTKHPLPALLKLQSLAGDWEGTDERGKAVRTSFRLIAGKTAVSETLAMSGMEEMVTIYTQDGDDLVLMHYCPTNNQPRMRAVPRTGEVKELVFAFEAAGNLASPDEGHEHQLVIQFQDTDHITERWTWRSNGKDSETVYRFARKNPQAR